MKITIYSWSTRVPAMTASFVLIHSPSVGPRTWQPVAHRLTERGWEATVPSLLRVADQGPPFWPPVVEAVRAGLGRAEQGRGVVLVAHSNAGLFLPVIAAALPGQVLGCVFVDAAIPPAAGAAPVAPPELLALLRDKASGGLLPRWSDWWEEESVAPLFPDQATRQAVTEEQPRLPLSYYEASVPVPTGWDAQPCAYLLFGPPYDEVASEARARGWIVQRLPGRHLHQLVDPDGVARSLLAIADQMGITTP
jgi:pimeloyl-ACP methyl ester carboxylesterase